MSEKKGRYGRPLILLALFLGLSFGIFFSATSNANATQSMSPDGKTCTPCHTDGRVGTGATGAAGGGQEQKPAGEAQKPAEQAPAAQVEQTPAPVAKEPASPVLVIGLVAVVLGVIYVAAIKKKH